MCVCVCVSVSVSVSVGSSKNQASSTQLMYQCAACLWLLSYSPGVQASTLYLYKLVTNIPYVYYSTPPAPRAVRLYTYIYVYIYIFVYMYVCICYIYKLCTSSTIYIDKKNLNHTYIHIGCGVYICIYIYSC